MKSSEIPVKTFITFFEGECGVCECTIGVFEYLGRRFLKPIAVRTASGTGTLLSRRRIEEALTSLQWAGAHSDLFGRSN